MSSETIQHSSETFVSRVFKHKRSNKAWSDVLQKAGTEVYFPLCVFYAAA